MIRGFWEKVSHCCHRENQPSTTLINPTRNSQCGFLLNSPLAASHHQRTGHTSNPMPLHSSLISFLVTPPYPATCTHTHLTT